MSAGGAAQDAVGAGDDVDVELGVDLQSGQDHVVHQPLVLQSADGAGSAAQSKAHLDAGLLHVFLQEAVDGQRGAANEMEQLRRGLDSMQGEICGTLRAGFSINYALYRLPDVLASYHKKYPMVRMDIATGHSRHLYQQMLEGNMDLAVLRGEYPWDGTQFLLSQESICLIHSREYKDVPLSDYLYIDHRSDAALDSLMARWRFENGDTGDTGSFVVDNITACLEMVKRGLGWALMPEIALDDFDGCIYPCTFENGEPFVRRTYIFCQRDAARLPQVQLFMNALKKNR